MVLAVGSATTFMVGCDDDEVTPGGTTLTEQEKKDAVVAASQVALDAKVKSSSSATGASNADAWDSWTFADKAGYVGNPATAAPAENMTKATTVDVDADITANTTWTKDKVYILKKRVKVKNSATLTIEAGTIIKGDATLTGVNAAVLMITREGKIMANGTAAEPIIFTSTLDKIEPGQIASPNLTVTDKAKWGGLVILGKANGSFKGDATEQTIEGVNADDADGKYGGSDDAHSSGTLKYVSIRHGGVEIAPDNEINGLTLGAVGSGTTIDFVEIYATLDDGVEFFGGSVNASNIIVVNQGDDGIDIDQSYKGTVNNFMVVLGVDESDKGLEIDGREGSAKASFTVKNGTVKAAGKKVGFGADLKSKAQGTIENVVFQDFTDNNGRIDISVGIDAESFTEVEDAAKNIIDGTLILKNVKFDRLRAYNK